MENDINVFRNTSDHKQSRVPRNGINIFIKNLENINDNKQYLPQKLHDYLLFKGNSKDLNLIKH